MPRSAQVRDKAGAARRASKNDYHMLPILLSHAGAVFISRYRHMPPIIQRVIAATALLFTAQAARAGHIIYRHAGFTFTFARAKSLSVAAARFLSVCRCAGELAGRLARGQQIRPQAPFSLILLAALESHYAFSRCAMLPFRALLMNSCHKRHCIFIISLGICHIATRTIEMPFSSYIRRCWSYSASNIAILKAISFAARDLPSRGHAPFKAAAFTQCHLRLRALRASMAIHEAAMAPALHAVAPSRQHALSCSAFRAAQFPRHQSPHSLQRPLSPSSPRCKDMAPAIFAMPSRREVLAHWLLDDISYHARRCLYVSACALERDILLLAGQRRRRFSRKMPCAWPRHYISADCRHYAISRFRAGCRATRSTPKFLAAVSRIFRARHKDSDIEQANYISALLLHYTPCQPCRRCRRHAETFTRRLIRCTTACRCR